jgi:hypothetical protein
MKKELLLKTLAIVIILSFICMSITPSSAIDNVERFSMSVSDGNILYVGGIGPDNYTRIQDAIDNATDGDTIFVFNGTYYEEVNLYKKINLIGENRDFTTINSLTNISDTVILITADYVKIYSFTITSKNNSIKTTYGIKIKSSYCNISNCNIIENSFGIAFFGKSNHNTVYRNNIEKDAYGIYLGFEQISSYFNVLKQNNFIKTKLTFSSSFFNYWIGNYYDNWIGIGPKIILGYFFIFPWVNFDWHPAKEPYDMSGG